MKPSKRPGGGGKRPGRGKKPWRRPQRRPTLNGLDNIGQDESIDEGEDEEYFDDFEENDYMEEEKEDFQDFGGGDTFGLDTEEEEEDNLQSLLPLSSAQPPMVRENITSHNHILLCSRDMQQ